MKKLSSLIIALFVIGIGTAFGQVSTSDNATFNAEATIVATALEIAEVTPLNFGTVSTNSTATITSDAANAGELSLTGEPGETVYIQFATTISLSNGTDSFDVTNVTAGTGTAGSTTAYTSGDPLSLDGSGNANLFIGGEINPGAVSAGSYTGQTTITAQYNSF